VRESLGALTQPRSLRQIEGKSREWVLNHVRAGQEVVVKEIESSGFKKVAEQKLLKENYFLVFEKVEASKEPRTMLIQPEELPKDLKRTGPRLLDKCKGLGQRLT
jgi:hypothetical protein